MAESFNNIRSKLNRAIVAHLIAEGAGSAVDCTPFLSSGSKVIPCTVVRAKVGKPVIPFSGNYDIIVHITIRGTATVEIGEIDAEAARRAFDERVAATYDALMQTDDNQTLRYTAKSITSRGRALAVDDGSGAEATLKAQQNADMEDFTCLRVEDGGFGDPNPNDQESLWEEVLVFEMTACGSNIGGYSLED